MCGMKPKRRKNVMSRVNGDGCVDGLFTPRSLQTDDLSDVGLKLEGGSPVNQSADVVFLAPPSPKGTIIAVYSACLEGNFMQTLYWRPRGTGAALSCGYGTV